MHGLTGEPKLAVGVSVSVNNSLSLSLCRLHWRPIQGVLTDSRYSVQPNYDPESMKLKKMEDIVQYWNNGIMKRSKSGKAGSHSMQTLGIVWHCCISSSFVVKSIYVHYLVPLPLKKELSEMSIEKMKGQFTS